MSNPTTMTIDDLMTHAGWLRRMATALLGDRDGADDAVQETLIAALQHPPRPEEGSVRGWFGTVVTNRVRQHARTDRRRQAAFTRAAEQPGDTVRTPEEVVANLELHRFLASLLLELGERYREVIYLRFFEDLESPEIARRLGISAGTVRWRLKMGLDELRTRLDARDGGVTWRRALAPLAGGGGLPIRIRPGALRLPLPLIGGATLAVVALGVGALAWRASHRPEARSEHLTAVALPGVAGALAGAGRPATRLPLPALLVAPAGESPPGPGGPGLSEGDPAASLAAVAPGQPEGAGAAADADKRAPFTGVRWRGEIPEVEVGGTWMELLAIDGVPAERIVAFCKARYPRPADVLWRKRFSEDLVEVLTAMKKPPGPRVTLALRNLADSSRTEVEAAMTSENRQHTWRRNLQAGTAGLPAPAKIGNLQPSAAGSPAPARIAYARVSPFTGLRFQGDTILVEVDGAWYHLLRLQGVPTDRLLAFARDRYGARWNKRLAEDPQEVLVDLGAKPGPTVDLVLQDPTTNRIFDCPQVPMTQENRRRLKDTWGPR